MYEMNIEKTVKSIRKRLEKRNAMRHDSSNKCAHRNTRKLDTDRSGGIIKMWEGNNKDGGPGSGNWGHEGRPGKIGGSVSGGGANNREKREKVGYISKKKAGDEKACDKAIKKAEDIKAKLPSIMDDNHNTWANCEKAVKSGKPIPSATTAKKDGILKNSTPEAQKAYDAAKRHEQRITRDMCEIASSGDTEMYGLDYSIKTAGSVEDKLGRKKAQAALKGGSFDATSEIKKMGDLVRYTQLCDHNKIASTAKQTMKSLRDKGYEIQEVDNKWIGNGSYKGFHLSVKSPEGQVFELQIHSKESMTVKEQNHAMYEPARKANASAYVRDTLDDQMRKLTNTMSIPEGIDDPELKSWKKGE